MILFDWYWDLRSVTNDDISHLPPGILLEKRSRTSTATLEDGRTKECVSQFMEHGTGLPEVGFPPSELPVKDT